VAAKGSVSFRITGFLHQQPVTASWRDGYLTADEELVDVANELIDTGYVFVALDPDRQVPASLTEPFAALLTVIRSFGQITRAKIDLPLEHDWREIFDGEGNVFSFRIDGPAGSAGDLDAGTSEQAASREA
jgi:hypothetical protein